MIAAITLVVEVIELVVILGIFCVIVNNEEMRRIIQSELQKKFGHVKPGGRSFKLPKVKKESIPPMPSVKPPKEEGNVF